MNSLVDEEIIRALYDAVLLKRALEKRGTPFLEFEYEEKMTVFETIRMQAAWRQRDYQKVVEHFFQEYRAGRTPNPDVMCNKEIKFGLFYNWAMTHGFDYLATGHYAAIITNQVDNLSALPALTIPADIHKDQTYFLYQLRENQLAHLLFPLANFTKTQVRQEAKNRNILVADKKDSVGICFIGDINVHDFLRDQLGENPGEVTDHHGQVIGAHQGLWFYTIGQRHGFQIDKKTLIKLDDGSTLTKDNIPPFYVIAKKPATNQLVVGFGRSADQTDLTVDNLHWINHGLVNRIDVRLVRIRHAGELIPSQVRLMKSNQAKIKLAKPVQGAATGQAAVFYAPIADQVVCLGGGIIS